MPSSKKTKLAIFDIDGTIFRSSLVIELVHGLIAMGIFPKKAAQEIKNDYTIWLDRKGDYNDYIMKVVGVYLKYHKGMSAQYINRAAKHVLLQHRDRVYRYTRELIVDLRKKNYMLIAISGSPHYIVEQFAEYLGFDKAFGTISEVQNGKFTGRRFDGTKFDVTGIPHKDVVLKKYIADLKLEIDFKKSFAIGDTEGDIPLLSLVGNPIAFNPNSTLALLAKKKKWKIVIERKDVVYEVTKGKFLRLGA